MSTEQQENLDAVLRQSAFPVGSDVNEQRRLLRELLSAQPLPADVTVAAAALGDDRTAEITVDGIEPRHVVLYFHGGVYVMGDASLAADLASQVGRQTQAKVIHPDLRHAGRLFESLSLQPHQASPRSTQTRTVRHGYASLCVSDHRIRADEAVRAHRVRCAGPSASRRGDELRRAWPSCC
jgi:hypothetical protein